jgi:hypothetical protein
MHRMNCVKRCSKPPDASASPADAGGGGKLSVIHADGLHGPCPTRENRRMWNVAYLASFTLLPALLAAANPPEEPKPPRQPALAPVDRFLNRRRILIFILPESY